MPVSGVGERWTCCERFSRTVKIGRRNRCKYVGWYCDGVQNQLRISSQLSVDDAKKAPSSLRETREWFGRRRIGGGLVLPGKVVSHQVQCRARPRHRTEPLDAELLILFGLPAVIILLAWVLKDGLEALAIIPLVLIIPGPRDVVLAVLRSTFVEMKRAKNFLDPERQDPRSRYRYWPQNFRKRNGSGTQPTFVNRNRPYGGENMGAYDLEPDQDFQVLSPKEKVNTRPRTSIRKSQAVGTFSKQHSRKQQKRYADISSVEDQEKEVAGMDVKDSMKMHTFQDEKSRSNNNSVENIGENRVDRETRVRARKVPLKQVTRDSSKHHDIDKLNVEPKKKKPLSGTNIRERLMKKHRQRLARLTDAIDAIDF